jgi:hypothetical protein
MLISVLHNTYAQKVEWAVSEPYPSYVTRINVVVADNNGNTFISGEHRFDGAYIIKYDNFGKKKWEYLYRKFNTIESLAVDDNGNLYATINICSINIENREYHKDNGGRYLLLKVSPEGKVIFVHQSDYGIFLVKNFKSNKAFLTGFFNSNSITLKGGISLENFGTKSCRFIGEINKEGNFLWATPDEGGYQILGTEDDYFYTIGSFYTENYSLGKGENQIRLLLKNGSKYFAKYTSEGTLVYAKQVNFSLLAPDKFGNVFTLEYDPAYAKTVSVTKYDHLGNFQWKRASFYTDIGYKCQMTCSSNGSLFISGGFDNYMKLADTTIYANGNLRTFVAKLDSAGKLQWIMTSSGQGGSGAKDVFVDGNQIYVTGDMGGGVNTFSRKAISEEQGVFLFKVTDAPAETDSEEDMQMPEDNKPIEFDFPAGIKESNSEDLIIFPNPNNGSFTLQHNLQNAISISIKNISGKTVYQQNIKPVNTQKKENINLNLPTGIYFVELQTEQLRLVKKVVVL